MKCPNCGNELGEIKKYSYKLCKCGKVYMLIQINKEMKLEDVTLTSDEVSRCQIAKNIIT